MCFFLILHHVFEQGMSERHTRNIRQTCINIMQNVSNTPSSNRRNISKGNIYSERWIDSSAWDKKSTGKYRKWKISKLMLYSCGFFFTCLIQEIECIRNFSSIQLFKTCLKQETEYIRRPFCLQFRRINSFTIEYVL